MPRRRSSDLRKILDSTDAACPHCGPRIEPKDYKCVDWDRSARSAKRRSDQAREWARVTRRLPCLMTCRLLLFLPQSAPSMSFAHALRGL